MKQYARFKERTFSLINAFDRDGYEVKKTVTLNGRIGMAAEHKTAVNYDTKGKKRAYYLEGTNYEMGHLLGLLAEQEISLMAVDFSDKVVFSFIGVKILEKIKILQELLISVVYDIAKGMYPYLPPEIRDEMQGICDGCKQSNPGTKVDMPRLIALNMGFDILCALVYTGNFLMERYAGLKPSDLRIPLMCNGFSVFGRAADHGHYFGRDFMFPTAGIFQNTAAYIIYNPDSARGKAALPFVSLTAPGIAGSISAMNIRGVAVGVNMSPAANCSPKNVGTNSLLLNHMMAQYGRSAGQAVEIARNTARGVSWNYMVSDGTNDKACVIEAGASDSSPQFVEFPPDDYRSQLPGMDFIDAHKSAELSSGMAVRWSDYKYPDGYLGYNYGLWKRYNKRYSVRKKLYGDTFAEQGYINKSADDKNCPSMYYFAPQRETNEGIIISTNHFIVPEMRYYSMHPWTSKIVGDKINDIQWRYDELNNQILTALKEEGYIGYATAKRLIDFLSPYGKFPSYYAGNPKSADGKEIRIEGCTSVFDLKNLSVESHFGYYCDDWVKITLPGYFMF